MENKAVLVLMFVLTRESVMSKKECVVDEMKGLKSFCPDKEYVDCSAQQACGSHFSQ